MVFTLKEYLSITFFVKIIQVVSYFTPLSTNIECFSPSCTRNSGNSLAVCLGLCVEHLPWQIQGARIYE